MMRNTLTSDNLSEMILQEYPDGFSSESGLTERQTKCSYNGTKVQSKQLFFDGVMIQYGKYSFQNSLILNSSFDHPIVEMHFCFGGQISGKLENVSKSFLLKKGEHSLSYVPESKGQFFYDKNSSLEGIEISFTPQYFQRFKNQDCKTIEIFLEAIEKQRVHQLPNNGRIDPVMRNVIEQMLSNPFKGTIKRLYIEAKTIELLSAQLDFFEQQFERKDNDHTAPRDLEKLQYAKFLIEQHLNNPPTISELSKMVSLNEFKLKQGFKKCFDTTVFGYITACRLEFTKRLLLDTNKSIGEISEMIGYSQQQHFSTAFKRKYGVSPSVLRNQGFQ